MKSTLIIAAIFAMGFTTCKRESLDNQADLAKKLRTSKSEVKLGDNLLLIEAELWRDFMPIAPEDGHPLRSLIVLSDKNGLELPSGIELGKQYVIKDNEVWTAEFEDTRQYDTFRFEGFSSGGPKWGPEAAVDVVLEFRYRGKPYFVMVTNRTIIKTM